MHYPIIIASGKRVDGQGSLEQVAVAEARLRDRKLRLTQLTIDPLAAGWFTPQAPDHFRSGCAPLEALVATVELLDSQACDAVVISGQDHIKSGYSKEQRRHLINVYGAAWHVPLAYTLLARAFMKRYNLVDADFKRLAERLFANYLRTARQQPSFVEPKATAFTYVTDLYRKVDCANPTIDFDGKLLIGNDQAAVACGITTSRHVRILGVAVEKLSGDGPEHVAELAQYRHLQTAWQRLLSMTQLDFPQLFFDRQAILEAYTCYPVVPLAFLLDCGFADSLGALECVLDNYAITVTGGMNLAKAPWNNPALQALIMMHERLSQGQGPYGCVHGNGGLGYKQGAAILQGVI